MKSATTPSNKLRLTKKAIGGLIATRSPDGPRRYWDTELPGMYLQFTPAGVASFCLRYVKPDGAKGDYTIARAAVVSPEQAREAAKEKLAHLVLKGEDPVATRTVRRAQAQEAKEKTFEAVARRYVAARKKQRPPGRPLTDEWVMETYVFPRIGRLPLEAVTRQLIKDLVRETQQSVATRNEGHSQQRQGKVTANRVHGAIRRALEWACDGEVLDRNPAAFKRMFRSRPQKRKGTITEARFGLVWRELEEKAQSQWQITPLAIQLYLLTLQRPIDIARARREHFDFQAREWRIPWSLTKTEDPYIVPLSEQVLERLREAFGKSHSEYLFPGPGHCRNQHVQPSSMGSRFKRAVRDLQAEGRWPEGPRPELYDFRRFGRTQLVHKLGFSKEVAELVINHAESAALDKLYDVHDYSDEVRAAQAAWSDEVWAHGRGGGPLMTLAATKPYVGMRPIRPTELSGAALMTARDASGRNRKEIALMSGLNPWTFRLAEICADQVRLPSSHALAVLNTYAEIGINLWIDENDSARLGRRVVRAFRADRAAFDSMGRSKMPQITPTACRAGRALLGFSRRQLAKISGVSVNTIARFESGHHILRHNRTKLVMAFSGHVPDVLDWWS